MSKWLLWVGIGLTILLLVGLWTAGYLPLDARNGATLLGPPQYVGASTCARCHGEQAQLWRDSHHAKSMQVASQQTVRGDFASARFSYAGSTSEFFKRDDKFFVRSDGPDGQLQDYQIRYTFGVYPLQQYLIELPGGRLQAFGIVWDARPKDQGGQRWYHLYPGQNIKAGDPLHWTGRNQNWNFMCAACHSTHLRKNYNLATDTFATTWSEINVACEACHGPGSAHVAWAQQPKKPHGNAAKGLVTELRREKGGHWSFGEGAAIAHWTGNPPPRAEADTCFACHARRRQLTEPAQPGQPFLDNYAATLLERGVYHADGQILDEVFEYGSFLQSKMYGAGVTCSNCHEPHSLKLRATGNTLCSQCHRADVFDRSEHHHHAADSKGTQCVSCHTRQQTYMGVDERRDHSFRVPRPDLTVTHKVPNACTQCHTNKPASWAAETVARWYGARRRSEPHFVTALDAAWQRRETAPQLLNSLARDGAVAGFARASAFALLPFSVETRDTFRMGLADRDPLVRAATVRALDSAPPAEQMRLAVPLLSDPVRAVRVAVARLLAGVPDTSLSPDQLSRREGAMLELIASENAAAERPESHVNLADLYARLGRASDAEQELKTALRLDPRFVPALINLADLYRALQRDQEGESLLQEATRIAPRAGEPLHALGLLRVRQGRQRDALELLAKAARLEPKVSRYSYVYGVALHATGDIAKAITVLEQAHKRAPTDRDILVALINFHWERGEKEVARGYADKLVTLSPGDPSVQPLRQRLVQ